MQHSDILHQQEFFTSESPGKPRPSLIPVFYQHCRGLPFDGLEIVEQLQPGQTNKPLCSPVDWTTPSPMRSAKPLLVLFFLKHFVSPRIPSRIVVSNSHFLSELIICYTNSPQLRLTHCGFYLLTGPRLIHYWAYLVAQLVQNLPSKQETPGSIPGLGRSPGEGISYSTILELAWWLRWWRIHLAGGRPEFNPWVGKIPQRRQQLPTAVFWPRESHGQKEPGNPWGCKESDTAEQLSLSLGTL